MQMSFRDHAPGCILHSHGASEIHLCLFLDLLHFQERLREMLCRQYSALVIFVMVNQPRDSVRQATRRKAHPALERHHPEPVMMTVFVSCRHGSVTLISDCSPCLCCVAPPQSAFDQEMDGLE